MTVRPPVVATQVTEKVRLVVSEAETVALRGFWPCTEQLLARPARETVCTPGARSWKVWVALPPMTTPAPPSTLTA